MKIIKVIKFLSGAETLLKYQIFELFSSVTMEEFRAEDHDPFTDFNQTSSLC